MQNFIKSWKFPVALITPGVFYTALIAMTRKDMPLEEWWNKVILFVFFPIIIVIASRFETPGMTRNRKTKERLKEAEKYADMTPEVKLLHKLTEKQTQTEANTRAIYAMIMGGAIGYLVFYFWPF